MKITVNLATRPFADLGPIIKRLRIAMIVFAVVSIALGIGLHLLHAKAEAARAKMQVVDDKVASINHERQGFQVMMRQPQNAQVLDQAGHLNALFDQKTFSWTLAMEDLETVLPGGVQVTTLEPVRDEKTGTITLKLRVVGPRDKGLELVQNLEHSRFFLHPAIVGESIENSGAPNAALEPVSASNRVNFDLNAEYNSATIGEHPTTLKAKESAKEEAEPPAVTAPAPKAAIPAVGPGLRRPPDTGVSHPVQPPPTQSAPPAWRPVPAPPNRAHYQTPSQVNPATTKPAPGRPGGPQ
jgi:type IV pilus assembly protein PilN